MKYFYALLLFVSVASTATAQQASSDGINARLANAPDSPPDALKQDWIFLQDDHHSVFYIDFAMLSGDFVRLVIRDRNSGNEMFHEDLMGLPKDVMYELDLSRLEDGEYTLELVSYTEMVKEDIVVKKSIPVRG